jgi:hypothetical protein
MLEKLVTDFNTYHDTCVTVGLVPFLRQAMHLKWVDEYDEVQVANLWMESWGGAKLTRIEACLFSPSGGGIPTDNNALEVSNREDKNSFERNRHHLLQFIGVVLRRVHERSQLDKDFCRKLKAPVHSQIFFGHLLPMEKKMQKGEPCPLNLSWTVDHNHHLSPYYASGSKVIVSKHFLNTEKEKLMKGKKGQRTWLTFEEILDKATCDYNKFVDFHRNPGNFQNSTFDTIASACRSFHVVSPLTLLQLLEFMWYMLNSNGYELLSLDEVRSVQGFFSCTCGTYRHYSWCRHSAVIALNRGAIKDIPKRRNPHQLSTRTNNVGRTAKAARGGALKKD